MTLFKTQLLPPGLFDEVFASAEDIFGGYKTNIPYNVAHLTDREGQVVSTLVEVALAGYSKDDIKVKVTNDELQILVDKTKKSEMKYIHKGIAERSAQLKFKLVSGYDVKNIKSVLKNGLLKVEIPVGSDNTIDIQVD